MTTLIEVSASGHDAEIVIYDNAEDVAADRPHAITPVPRGERSSANIYGERVVVVREVPGHD